jgi:phosphate transport system substrate-binding protein
MYEELEDIFLGKRRNWKQVGGKESPMTVYGVATNTLAGELFSLEVLTGKAITNDVRLVSQVELLNAIARDPNAIGFGDFSGAPGVRALKIKRVYSSTPVEPNADAIANRIYPISQYVCTYLNPEVNQGEIKSYVDWIRSDEGQQVATQAGCFAVPAKWRTP